MGDYYSVRMRGIVKPEFDDTWNRILDRRHAPWTWECEANLKFPVPEIVQYAQYSRANYIPWGVLSYAPEVWGVGFERTRSVVRVPVGNEGVVQFACSVKDLYVIERFFVLIVGTTFESVETFQVMFEREPNIRHWTLVPGGQPAFVEEIRPDFQYLYGKPERGPW